VGTEALSAADGAAQRQRLGELARLGARVQEERSEEAVLAIVRQGLSALGLGAWLLRPAGDGLQVVQPAGEAGPPAAHPWTPWALHVFSDGAAHTDDGAPEAERLLGIAPAAAGGPLRAVGVRVDLGDAPSAILVVAGDWPRQGDLPAFRLFGSQVQASLVAARTIRDLEGRNAELAALNRLAAAAATAPDLPSFFARGAGELMRSVGCDGVGVWLLDEKRAEMEMAFEVGASAEARRTFARVPLGDRIARVLSEQAPLLLRVEGSSEPLQPLVAGLGGHATHVLVPLRVRSKAVGIVAVGFRAKRDAEAARLDVLQAMAGPFAAAVEARRLLGDLRGRVAELTLLNDVAVASANLDPAALLENALRRLVATVEADAGTAYLLEGDTLVRMAGMGLDAETLSSLARFPSSEGSAGEAVRRLAPVRIPSMREGNERDRWLHEQEGLESAVSVPLLVKSRPLGALVIGRRTARPFDDSEVSLLAAVAAQLGVAVENARLFVDTRRRLADLEAVNAFALSVFAAPAGDVRAILEGSAREIGRALQARAVVALLHEEGAKLLRSAAGWGAPLPPRPVLVSLEGDTLAAEALRTQAPVQVDDTSADPRSGMVGVAGAPAMAMLMVPLTSRRAARGVVAIGREPGRRFGAAEVALASALAGAAAIALENAELHAETAQRAEELGLLLQVGRSLVATLELDQVLDAGVRNLARIVGAPDAYLFLADPSQSWLEIRAAAGSFPELVGSRVPMRPAKDALASLVFERREPLVLEDGAPATGLPADVLGVNEGSACLGLPLVVRDRTIGAALIVDPQGPRHFTPADVERAAAIANQLAVAAENARLYEDLRKSYAELGLAQAQVIQQERLAALGEFSAVVAHEVRNPLGVIFNSLGSLRRLVRPEGDAKMLLDIVGEEAERLNRIVGDLLDFARPSTPVLRPESLPRLLEEVLAAALGENPQGIAVVREIDPELPLVPIDARLLRQAILNVAVNAVQAMQRGGKLAVRARREGPAVRLEIEDSGAGIPEEVRHRIFEPFFTTKASGTGLGLAVVKRIVEGHGGQVAVESSPGAGARFSIRLPLEAPQARPGGRGA
jgi:signal transduction histidine kinase